MKKRKRSRGQYGSGYSIVGIAGLMGCHVATARRWLKANQILPGCHDEELGNLIWLYREQKQISGVLKELKKIRN